MRYLVGFVIVLALPLSASAQSDKAGATSEPEEQEVAPPSESTPEEGDSRLKRWHPEAFEDPSKSAPEPSLELDLDSAGLEVTPTVPTMAEEERKREEETQRRRRRGFGIGIPLVVVLGLLVGMAAAAQ